MDLTLYHSLDAGPRWVDDLFAWPATYLPAVIVPIVRADVPAAVATAVSDAHRRLQAMRAKERPTAADWPVRLTLEVIVGAVGIARELEQLEDQQRRDTVRLLAGPALDGLASLVSPRHSGRSLQRHDGAAAAVDELVVWLRARLGQNSAPGG